MRILMLGWEFPPYISGGLGTACYGLTKALASKQVQITFVLPKRVGSEYRSHVRMLTPQQASASYDSRPPEAVASTFQYAPEPETGPVDPRESALKQVVFKAVPSRIMNPYQTSPTPVEKPQGIGFLDPANPSAGTNTPANAGPSASAVDGVRDEHTDHQINPGTEYQGDLYQEARRYADLVLDLAKDQEFDVIHAHDWLTFPAGQAVAAATGKPLVVHVHSTEFDRSGENISRELYEIERTGVHAATKVVAVSHLTRQVLESRYHCPAEKISVVYNGLENGTLESKLKAPDPPKIEKTDKIVLFLGRITMQKGPEYFIQAAKRVLDRYDRVKFVMAGTGDKVKQIIELAALSGIGHKVLFTGFLRGEDVAKVFRMADVFVMPSVSEPFGIAPLEAIAHDVPVIISRSSGVAEVLDHVLKVDFWDTEEMANKIVAVLKYPPLSETLRHHAELETRRLTWDAAADRLHSLYTELSPTASPAIPAKVDEVKPIKPTASTVVEPPKPDAPKYSPLPAGAATLN